MVEKRAQMEDVFILMSSSSVVTVIVCIVALWWLWKKGYLILGSRGPSGPGELLPVPPLKKSGSPWYVQYVTSEENVSITQKKLKISYQAGKIGSKSGGAIHANPFNSLPANSCVFSYKIYVPPNIDFVKGGKLCGVCLGQDSRDCATGSKWSNTGGSYRLTFDGDGAVHPYLYLPFGSPSRAFDVQGPEFKKESKKVNHAGLHVWRRDSPLKLRKGQWNAISMRIVLNTPGQANGYMSATVNGVTREMRSVNWRSSTKTRITMVAVVSFYGGGDSSYNAPSDAYALFDDFRFSAV